MLDTTNELGELKSLLFEDEIDSFHTLEKQISELQLASLTIEEIIVQITPKLDDLLLKRLSSKDSHTVEIYAKHLAQIIQKSSQVELPALSNALQPVLSSAISKEIEDNQDKMVDALYPIMGGMISKYVTNAIQEMMEKINSKIEDGLSFNSYKRKLKAKVSGVTETELLVEESNDALIRSLFIIDKDSSILIAQEDRKNQEINDPSMVASMASAIKDFINDWIVDNKESSGVQLVSYGNSTLYIESAGSVYLVSFLDTEPNHEQRREIQEFFAIIVQKYSYFFHSFEGDDSVDDVIEIKKEMKDFLDQQIIKTPLEKKKNGNVAKYVLMILLIVLLLYLGWIAKDKYDIYQLEQYVYEKTGETISLSQQKNSLYLQGYVSNIDHYDTIEQMMRKETHMSIVNQMYIPPQHSKINGSLMTNELSDLENKVAFMKKRLNVLEDKYKKMLNALKKKTDD